jgi:predicted PurR-regulated permease PerM
MTGEDFNPTPEESRESANSSPTWSTNAKLVVGMTMVALAAGIAIQFRPLLPPLIMALILSYLLYPMIDGLERKTALSWRGSTNIIFLVLLIILISSLTISGVAIVNQFQNLIGIVDTFLTDLPSIVEDFISNGAVIQVPIIDYEFDVAEYISTFNIDLLDASNQVLSAVQPILGQAGTILTTVATSAFGILGWGSFILAIAYLSLGEARQGRKFLKSELEGMSDDIGRLSRELSNFWNAFLRGQVLIFLISASTMFVLMSILGVRYALGLAVLAGFARFVPYVGQVLSTIVTALVAFFLAEGNYLGMEPLPYMLLVVGLGFVHDQIYDSMVVPRLFGVVLGVHPALVLITALILARWIGVLGLLVAAPVLASFQLLTSYVIRKLLDQDPWPDPEISPPTLEQQVRALVSSARDWIGKVWNRLSGWFKNLIEKIRRRKKQNE